MVAALVLLVLVAGFYACRRHPVYAYHIHRYEGQFLYLKSAEMGMRCVVAAFLISFLWSFFPDRLEIRNYYIRLDFHAWLVSWAKERFGIEAQLAGSAAAGDVNASLTRNAEIARWTYGVGLSLLSLAVARMWGTYAKLALWFTVGRSMTKEEGNSAWKRFRCWSPKTYAIGQLLKDSPIDKMLFELSTSDQLAMLSMSDRKVYVGRISSLGEPSETGGVDQDILILPYMSGYRDKDRLTVEFTTHYNHVNQEISLSLRQADIVSATEFNAKAYDLWKNINTAPETKPLKVDIGTLPPLEVKIQAMPPQANDATGFGRVRRFLSGLFQRRLN